MKEKYLHAVRIYRRILRMKQVKFTFLGLLLLGGFYFIFFQEPSAKEINIVAEGESDIKTWSWDNVLKEAKAGLSKFDLKVGSKKILINDTAWLNKRIIEALDFQEIGLALLPYDPKIINGKQAGAFVGEMLFAKITRQGQDFINPRIVDLKTGQENPADIEVLTQRSGILFNGWNNIYKVNQPVGYVVVLNRYPNWERKFETLTLRSRDKNGRIQKVSMKKAVIKDIYYSPFSKDIFLPEFINEGDRYLKGVVKEANQELLKNNVYSLAHPGTLVAHEVEDDVIFAIPHIEHSDYGEVFFDKTDGKKTAFERVKNRFGQNKENTFTSTSSSADARGSFQFTKGTYVNPVRKNYQSANLIADFEKGTSNDVNSAKAAMLLIDSNRANLLDYVKENEAKQSQREARIVKLKIDLTRTKNQERVNVLKNEIFSLESQNKFWSDVLNKLESRAFYPQFRWETDLASYNGGIGRTKKALQDYASGSVQDWAESKELAKETREFLFKFRYFLEVYSWREIFDKV